MLKSTFWESASSAIQTFSSTLDQLDRTVGADDSDGQGPEDSDEMVACRALLEKAQMDIVQMSQQSRVLIAEKEASINMWRQKYLESTGNIEPADISSLIDMEALLTERNALLENLSSLEEQLRAEHSKASGPLIKAQMYDDLLAKYNNLNEEFSKVVEEEERKSKASTETIEHLVSEYTNLGAEFERRQATDAARIQEVERENEVLTMKLLAMEHSITDFADRASASSSANGTVIDSNVSQNDIKELRAKLVNSQYDIKEKEDELSRLRMLLEESNGSRSCNNVATADIDAVNHTLDSLRAELSKVSVEREEAETIARAAFEDSQKMQREVDELKAALKAAEIAVMGKVEDELNRLREEVSALVSDLDDKSAQCVAFEVEIGKIKGELEAALLLVEDKSNKLVEITSGCDHHIAQANHETSSANAAVLELQKKIDDLEEAHKIALNDVAVESEKNILQRIEKEIMVERSKCQAEKENALNNLRVELEDSFAMMMQQKHEEMAVLMSRNLLELQETCNAEKECALKKQASEIEANSDNALRALRQQLEGASLGEASKQLSDQRAEFEAILEKTVAEIRQNADKERADAVKKQKDEDEELFKQTCADIRVELMKSFTCDSEQKIQSMTAEFDVRLGAAIAEERQNAKQELITALENQVKADAAAKTQAVEDACTMLEKQLLVAEEERLKILRSEFDKKVASAVDAEKQKSMADISSAVQNQADEDAAVLEKVIGELKEELLKAHAEDRLKLQEEASATLSAFTAAAAASAELALVAAVQKQKDEDDKAMAAALEALEEAKRSEITIALAKAAEDLRSAVDAEKEAGRLALEKSVAEWSERVEEKVKALSEAKIELEIIQRNFDENLKTESELICRQKDIEKAREISEIRIETEALVAKAKAEREEFLTLYTKEYKQRKLIHNKLLEIQGNIRVMCRVRPVLEVERRMAADVDVTEIPNEDTIIIHRDVATKNRYEFDQVFPPASTQEQVFDAVQPLVISVLDGYNVCIFAYGQTGSGKTFTMEGSPDKLGVSPRAINELFRVIESVAEDWVYTVTFSTLEIYNETIRDLLDPAADKEKLDVRQTPNGNSVPGLTEVQVTSASQVMSLLSQGQSNRAVGSHDMNEHSSRSHSILTLVCQGKCLRDGNTTYGKLHLIDLAGSERVGKTDASGDRLKEAQNINRSLSALGDVINALGNKKNSHIPYRNSKLTFLLQDSLGGNSKVMMFVNTSPAVYNLGETVCSLNFAARCRNVELGNAKRQSDSAEPASAPPLIKSLVKRSSSSVGSSSGGDAANRRSTFGTPSARK